MELSLSAAGICCVDLAIKTKPFFIPQKGIDSQYMLCEFKSTYTSRRIKKLMARNKGPKIPKAPAGPKYEAAPEDIKKLAARLIDQHHSRLAEASISYLMRNGTWKKKGEVVDADVSVISGANRFELGTNFRVTINAEVWNQASEEIRAYILDKQLSKCIKEETASGDVKWSTRDFYLKEFPSLIERYGVVTDEQRRLVEVLKNTNNAKETEALLA